MDPRHSFGATRRRSAPALRAHAPDRTRLTVSARLGLSVALAAAMTATVRSIQPVTAALDYGPHAVGFRYVIEIDHTPTHRDQTDDAPPPGQGGTPIEIGIWYPAARVSGAPMTALAYRSLRAPVASDSAAAGFVRMASVAGVSLSAAQATESLTRPSRAHRDAPAAPGSFPLLLQAGFLSGPWILNEYLASHGYVVVMTTTSGRTASLQSERPALALETHLHNLEFADEFASARELGDRTRTAVLGTNFDGVAALIYQMRTGRANAVVSIDGIEAKAGTRDVALQSPSFDPEKMRAPYLLFVQDEPNPRPSLRHDRGVWDALTHSTRYWHVLNGFNHIRLIGDVGQAMTLDRDQQAGYVFINRTIRRFLDAYVKRDAASRAQLEGEAPDARLPASLRNVSDRRIAR
jgi:hypothetical protein